MAGKNPLSGLLGRSPIGPIQEHMENVDRTAALLPALFGAAAAGDWATAADLDKQIAAAEAAADKLKHSIRRHLPKSLFMPVPRADLLELVASQDRIATTAQKISATVVWRKQRFPAQVQTGVDELAVASAATSQQALIAIQELDELLEVGFTGAEVKRVEAMLRELSRMERRAQRLTGSLRSALLPLEAGLPPVDAVFCYETVSGLGALADNAKAVGDRLQILLAR
jgi:predicted phosphate transport protein (TIGR00153 family)